MWIRVCTILLLGSLAGGACSQADRPDALPSAPQARQTSEISKIHNDVRVIHVLVALCDNANQGIVPVPARLGNGSDPQSNLYWGAAFGVKTFFSNSKLWKKVSEVHGPKPNVLERVIFRRTSDNTILVADAYDGSKMKETIDDFFSAASGNRFENLDIDGSRIQVLGSSDLIAFVGHDGLMDFRYTKSISKKGSDTRDVFILACASKNYFANTLQQTGANPILWTTNLMAPEAYVLHEAIEGWLKHENGQQIRERAAVVYAKYQKISPRSALGLFASGW